MMLIDRESDADHLIETNEKFQQLDGDEIKHVRASSVRTVGSLGLLPGARTVILDR